MVKLMHNYASTLMPNLPLSALAGTNTTQDGTKWEIKKDDLALVGLNCPPGSTTPTPKAINSPTSLLVAILKNGSLNFTKEAQDANPAINMVIEVSPYSQVDYVDGINYDVTTYNVKIRKPKADASIDPDDYDS